jgi:hypothetical protein
VAEEAEDQNNNQQQPNEQENNPGKVQKQFDETLRKIAAVLKDDNSPMLIMKREIRNKENELTKLKTEKQKEFVKAANKVLGSIANLGEIQKEYAESLKSAGEGQNETDNKVS